jgi:hypothetical protein
MLFYIVALVVLYMSITANKETLPHTPSHLVYERMVDNGDDALLFLEMETALIEADSVGRAIEISLAIKERFPNYEFGYHTEMIKSTSRDVHGVGSS